MKKNKLYFFAFFLISLAVSIFKSSSDFLYNFHPDSLFYLQNSGMVCSEYITIGQGYQFISCIFGANEAVLIFINMIMYAAISAFIFDRVRTDYIGYVFSILYLSNIYLLHLSTVVLKEVPLLFFITLLVHFWSRRQWIFVFACALVCAWLRPVSILVFIFFGDLRWWILTAIICLLALWFLAYDALHFYLHLFSTIDLHSRAFDRVPAFVEFGSFGMFFRALFWPVLYITGSFVLFSPSVYMAMAAFSVSALGGIVLIMFEKHMVFRLYLLLGMLAAIVPGFTSFYRYGYVFLLAFIVVLVIKKWSTDETHLYCGHGRVTR